MAHGWQTIRAGDVGGSVPSASSAPHHSQTVPRRVRVSYGRTSETSRHHPLDFQTLER